MNKVILVGRLTKDPIVTYTQGEQSRALARYTLAVDRRFRRDGSSQADFISCKAWGQQGEFAEKYLRKGMKIGVVGRIETGSYQDRDGRTVYTTDVIVEEHEFVESKAANADNGGGYSQSSGRPAPSSASAGDGFMNIPDGIDEELPFN